MGVVKRQGIKQSMVTYVGVLLGAVNILFIYPNFLTEEQFGIFEFVRKAVELLIPFALLGSSALVIRFFPEFRDEARGHQGFLPTLFVVALSGILLTTAVAFLFKDQILGFYGEKSVLYLDYLPYILPALAFAGLAYLLTLYASNFQRIVVPTLFNNLLLKVSIPVFVVLFGLGYLPFSGVMKGYVISFFVVFLALLLYIRYLGELHLKPNFGFLNRERRQRMGTYVTYGLLGGLGMQFATRIDANMVGTLAELKDVATYGIALYMAEAIDIPRRAIGAISAPLVAASWKDQNMAHLHELYRKSSLNQLIVGLYILIGIWVCIDPLFELIPNGERYAEGKYVVLILGLAKIVDMITGLNSEIIAYSRFFRFNFYAILLLAIFNVLCNLLLIPPFAVNGAALATLASVSLYNLSKFVFIYRKFDMQPLSLATLWALVIAAISYVLVFFLPATGQPLLDIIIRAAGVTLIFGGSILYFGISDDINELVEQGWKKLKDFIGK